MRGHGGRGTGSSTTSGGCVIHLVSPFSFPSSGSPAGLLRIPILEGIRETVQLYRALEAEGRLTV